MNPTPTRIITRRTPHPGGRNHIYSAAQRLLREYPLATQVRIFHLGLGAALHSPPPGSRVIYFSPAQHASRQRFFRQQAIPGSGAENTLPTLVSTI